MLDWKRTGELVEAWQATWAEGVIQIRRQERAYTRTYWHYFIHDHGMLIDADWAETLDAAKAAAEKALAKFIRPPRILGESVQPRDPGN